MNDENDKAFIFYGIRPKACVFLNLFIILIIFIILFLINYIERIYLNSR